jgi:hypothetical protein
MIGTIWGTVQYEVGDEFSFCILWKWCFGRWIWIGHD